MNIKKKKKNREKKKAFLFKFTFSNVITINSILLDSFFFFPNKAQFSFIKITTLQEKDFPEIT